MWAPVVCWRPPSPAVALDRNRLASPLFFSIRPAAQWRVSNGVGSLLAPQTSPTGACRSLAIFSLSMFSTGRLHRNIDLQESLKKHGAAPPRPAPPPPPSTIRLRISRGDPLRKMVFSGEDCIMQRCMSPTYVSAAHRTHLVLLEK